MKYSIELFGAVKYFDSLQEIQKVIKDLQIKVATTGEPIKVAIQIIPST